MPYHDNPDGSRKWLYEHTPETTGDPLRVAGEWFARNVESFLFDYDHPGFGKPEYLSWCLAHFDVLKSGSVPGKLTWDPAEAALIPDRSGQPRNSGDFALRYPQAAFDADHIDTSGAGPGESELYAANEVSDPFMARFHPGYPTVVGHKYPDPDAPPPAPNPFAADASEGKDGS